MTSNGLRLLSVAMLMMMSGFAQAVNFNCSLGIAPAYNQVYSETVNSATALSVTVTCQKIGGGGGRTINFTVTPNNGNNPSGSQNRAANAGFFINYDLYTDSSCTTPWSGAGSIAMPGGGGNPIRSQMLTYYGCVPAVQPLPPPPRIYSDNVSLTLAAAANAKDTVTITGANPRIFAVMVTVNATCTMSTPPGTVNFGTYTAFQGSAKTANTSFAATCTNTTPYSLTLDAAGGVVSGLNYSLGLNTTANTGGTTRFPSFGDVAGTGSAQTYYVNGTMPANQAGTCAGASCPGTNVHTLTITY